MQSILIDVGPLIALFFVEDKHHYHYEDMTISLNSFPLKAYGYLLPDRVLLKQVNRWQIDYDSNVPEK